MLSIGVDIGGTKVAAGVVDEEGGILDRWQEPTPSHSPQAVEDAIVRAVEHLRERHRVEAVGVGAAGWVDNDQAVVRFSPTWLGGPSRSRPGSAGGSSCRSSSTMTRMLPLGRSTASVRAAAHR